MRNSSERNPVSREEADKRRLGFALRRRRILAEGAWHETVTHFKPEPWLLALKNERIGLPLRPGHRPAANR
jgi:hypothetical protein